jgi:DNA-binding MarR family transcriptional regulator
MVSARQHPNQLYQRLRAVLGRIQKAEAGALPEGLTLPQARVLDHLNFAPWPLSMKVIALEYGCSVANAMRISERLRRKGLVSENCDGRAMVVSLTEKGRALASILFIDSGEAVDKFFSRLSKAGREDLAAALSVLEGEGGAQ